jgi:sugar lactone lactonase YvrE
MSLRRRPIRWGRISVIIVVAVLAGVGARAIWANGIFAHAPTGFAGSCKVAGHLPGIADIEIAHNMAFISASSAHTAGKDDGLYALPLTGGGRLVKLAGTPKDFHPRGIGLTASPNGSGLFLLAVNRRGAASAGAGIGNRRFSIDSFEVTNPDTAPALVAEGTIEGGLLTNPQDVAAAGPGTFYVANGTAGSNPILHALAAYGVISGGNVLYFNGMSFRVMADGLYGTRSLALTPDGQHLIVAGLLSRDLKSFAREGFSGTLTEDKSLNLPAGPEKITLDSRGDLWVAAHANLPDWRAFSSDPSKPSASQVLRVSLLGGVPQSVDQVYGNDGSQIGGASVAASNGKHLLVGSSLDGRLLDCTLP